MGLLASVDMGEIVYQQSSPQNRPSTAAEGRKSRTNAHDGPPVHQATAGVLMAL